MLHLIKTWLEAPAEEIDERGISIGAHSIRTWIGHFAKFFDQSLAR
jgi:hypothetical protein